MVGRRWIGLPRAGYFRGDRGGGLRGIGVQSPALQLGACRCDDFWIYGVLENIIQPLGGQYLQGVCVHSAWPHCSDGFRPITKSILHIRSQLNLLKVARKVAWARKTPKAVTLGPLWGNRSANCMFVRFRRRGERLLTGQLAAHRNIATCAELQESRSSRLRSRMPDPKTVFDNAGIVLAAVLDAETDAEVTQITDIPDEAAAEAAIDALRARLETKLEADGDSEAVKHAETVADRLRTAWRTAQKLRSLTAKPFNE